MHVHKQRSEAICTPARENKGSVLVACEDEQINGEHFGSIKHICISTYILLQGVRHF